MPKSVLVVSYFFPPVGGAGVQRAAKFVKYLPACGWAPTVLTVSNPSVPLFDDSMLAEIPASVEIVKAKTLEPDYKTKHSLSASAAPAKSQSGLKTKLKNSVRAIANTLLQPDPQVLWLPAALREGKKLLKAKKFDAIFVTAPPFSSLVLGAMLSRDSGVPLVVDYRDEWDISNSVWENKISNGFASSIQSRMQRFVLKQANTVIATTSLSVAALKQKLQALGKTATSTACIYNGFDPDDFAFLDHNEPKARSAKIKLSYVGTLWNLTSIAPLVTALEQMYADSPTQTARIELEIAGRRTADQEAVLARLNATNVTLTLHDYLDHSDALKMMWQSDVLVLLLSDYEFAGRVVPAKTFEYMALRNTILALCPKGEVWSILDGMSDTTCISPADIASIKTFLSATLARTEEPFAIKQAAGKIEQFNRVNLTAELADVLNKASETGNRA
ncbi:MAG: glycosyltransferase [Pseudomonadota bacterium]